LIVWWLDC